MPVRKRRSISNPSQALQAYEEIRRDVVDRNGGSCSDHGVYGCPMDCNVSSLASAVIIYQHLETASKRYTSILEHLESFHPSSTEAQRHSLYPTTALSAAVPPLSVAAALPLSLAAAPPRWCPTPFRERLLPSCCCPTLTRKRQLSFEDDVESNMDTITFEESDEFHGIDRTEPHSLLLLRCQLGLIESEEKKQKSSSGVYYSSTQHSSHSLYDEYGEVLCFCLWGS
ncbi:hypothetical protein RIF29_25338 [Crotalaria pallida]|uniref:Uncharacterized protein n=1 Tax=Crotalaria pallida TaxID=3830 RepID=A0AAN9ERD3_CROPI